MQRRQPDAQEAHSPLFVQNPSAGQALGHESTPSRVSFLRPPSHSRQTTGPTLSARRQVLQPSIPVHPPFALVSLQNRHRLEPEWLGLTSTALALHPMQLMLWSLQTHCAGHVLGTHCSPSQVCPEAQFVHAALVHVAQLSTAH